MGLDPVSCCHVIETPFHLSNLPHFFFPSPSKTSHSPAPIFPSSRPVPPAGLDGRSSRHGCERRSSGNHSQYSYTTLPMRSPSVLKYVVAVVHV